MLEIVLGRPVTRHKEETELCKWECEDDVREAGRDPGDVMGSSKLSEDPRWIT